MKEIDQRCKEVDALKVQLSEELNSLQRDHDKLSHKLAEVTAENKDLVQKLENLEEKNCFLTTQSSETTVKWTRQCSLLKSRLTSISSHTEQVESENSALRSQLAYALRYIQALSKSK